MKNYKIPLSVNNRPLYIQLTDQLMDLYNDLEYFLSDDKYIENKDFTQHLWFSNEIKYNNSIEGYYDDVDLINSVIQDNKMDISSEQRRRIINLFKGYKYILNHNTIDKQSLKGLYNILSKDLLCKYDLEHMGELYREEHVNIWLSSNEYTPPDFGIKANKIDDHMNQLFEYINNSSTNTMTDAYLVSQITHFYFVYVHPYFDINGRSSRTLSMWYLLNSGADPYIIFNRGIQYKLKDYYQLIRRTKRHHNVTGFLEYMLKNVKKELEKEYIVDTIEDNKNISLTPSERQTIQYLLSMNQTGTIKDFAKFYNYYNSKKKPVDVLQNMIEPLLEYDILDYRRKTNNYINKDTNNFIFGLRNDAIQHDESKIKHLILK